MHILYMAMTVTWLHKIIQTKRKQECPQSQAAINKHWIKEDMKSHIKETEFLFFESRHDLGINLSVLGIKISEDGKESKQG